MPSRKEYQKQRESIKAKFNKSVCRNQEVMGDLFEHMGLEAEETAPEAFEDLSCTEQEIKDVAEKNGDGWLKRVLRKVNGRTD